MRIMVGECVGQYGRALDSMGLGPGHVLDEFEEQRWVVDPESSDRLAASAAAIARLRVTGQDLASRIKAAVPGLL